MGAQKESILYNSILVFKNSKLVLKSLIVCYLNLDYNSIIIIHSSIILIEGTHRQKIKTNLDF